MPDRKRSNQEASESPGRFAYDGLERAIHEKARLGILTSLIAHPAGLLFSDLKELCSLTDGNLNRHLRVLREAGLVEVWKGTSKNRPQTLCRLTDNGRARFIQYLGELERVVSDAAEAADAPAQRTSPKTTSGGLLDGLSPA